MLQSPGRYQLLADHMRDASGPGCSLRGCSRRHHHADAAAHVQENASVVESPEQHSLLTLPDPGVVAGDRFREVYYWDSYWIVLGLITSRMTETATVCAC